MSLFRDNRSGHDGASTPQLGPTFSESDGAQTGLFVEGGALGTVAASAASAASATPADPAASAPADAAPAPVTPAPADAAPATPKKKRRGPRVSTVVAVVIFIVGIGIIAYPTVSDWWNSYHQSRAIASYINAVQETDPAKLQAMLDEAHAYNERLLKDDNRYVMTDAEKAEYESLLNLTGDGVMGVVQINAIGVDYPIYHGLDEAVLQVAIGHLEGSSLPVGGESTHAVISGHRGLPSARLFTDLDKLVEGDTFTITVLNQVITYEVDQVRIVEPTDLSNLNIEPGRDYCTLVTCTPYGINTHRMLVRGHRIDNIEDTDVVTAEALQIPRYIAIPAVAIPMLFALLVGLLVYYRVRRPELNKEVALSALRDMAGKEGGDE